MDYKEQAKELLSRKKNLISAYSAIRQELESLEQEKYDCKTALVNCDNFGKGNRSVFEDRLINILVNMDDCRFRRNVVERELSKIEKGMGGLTDYQKDLLETFFVENDSGAADGIMERWFKERSSVYRDRSRALEMFTRSIYGVLQL